MAVLLNGTNGLIQAYDYQVLTTGFSYTFAAGTQTLVINPAGTLAAGTITMPASPSDGMTITFSTTKQITALTLNGNTGQTVVGGVSVLPANQATTYIYRSANTSWFPLSTVATNAPVTPAGGSIITSGTAVASTSGTSIDFTGIPSWVKRITVIFNGTSLSGASVIMVQIGAGSVDTTNYVGLTSIQGTGGTASYVTSTIGFGIGGATAANLLYGTMVLTLLGSNTWVSSSSGGIISSGSGYGVSAGGNKTLSGTLDRVRITTYNGTDTFDAGSINILYE